MRGQTKGDRTMRGQTKRGQTKRGRMKHRLVYRALLAGLHPPSSVLPTSVNRLAARPKCAGARFPARNPRRRCGAVVYYDPKPVNACPSRAVQTPARAMGRTRACLLPALCVPVVRRAAPVRHAVFAPRDPVVRRDRVAPRDLVAPNVRGAVHARHLRCHRVMRCDFRACRGLFRGPYREHRRARRAKQPLRLPPPPPRGASSGDCHPVFPFAGPRAGRRHVPDCPGPHRDSPRGFQRGSRRDPQRDPCHKDDRHRVMAAHPRQRRWGQARHKCAGR